jgi:hypothetical protein
MFRYAFQSKTTEEMKKIKIVGVEATWCLSVIGVLSELPLMLFDKMDIG